MSHNDVLHNIDYFISCAYVFSPFCVCLVVYFDYHVWHVYLIVNLGYELLLVLDVSLTVLLGVR